MDPLSAPLAAPPPPSDPPAPALDAPAAPAASESLFEQADPAPSESEVAEPPLEARELLHYIAMTVLGLLIAGATVWAYLYVL